MLFLKDHQQLLGSSYIGRTSARVSNSHSSVQFIDRHIYYRGNGLQVYLSVYINNN